MQKTNIFMYLAIIVGVFIAIKIIAVTVKCVPADDILLFISLTAYALTLATKCDDMYFCIGILAFVLIIVYYLMKKNRLSLSKIHVSNGVTLTAVILFGGILAGFIASITVARYLTFSAPNYDFGIFCNMFYNMKKTLLPIVSCERDQILSHFAVHISPIYYLILPFYAIFPSPVTLQIAQGVIVASGIVPVYMLSKKLGLGNKITICVSAVYCFYPALTCGCTYDIHENAFLVPLILWMFYFIEKSNFPLMYVFALLTLTVKEDAAVYVAFIALFLILSKRKYMHGAILFVISLLYFLGVTYILEHYGEGVMTSRYNNFFPQNGEGLTDVLKTVFINPALVFFESFNTEKFLFLLQMLVPLVFLPFSCKKLSRYILILPMWLINLMPDYKYQHSIYFQYIFASSALLIYFSLLNLADMKSENRKYQATFAVIASAMIFCATAMSKAPIVERYFERKVEYAKMEECLDIIPEGASVKSSTFLLPHISDRDEIYGINTKNSVEYAAVDIRYEDIEYYLRYIDSGYELVSFYEGHVAVFKISE